MLWTAFRASLRNVRGSNLIGPFLTRHMTSCMLAVYIVLLSFLRTQRKVMMAARSRLEVGVVRETTTGPGKMPWCALPWVHSGVVVTKQRTS